MRNSLYDSLVLHYQHLNRALFIQKEASHDVSRYYRTDLENAIDVIKANIDDIKLAARTCYKNNDQCLNEGSLLISELNNYDSDLIVDGPRVPLFRKYNPYSGDHFYTIDSSEGPGWTSEGIAGFVLKYGSDNSYPIYRYYNHQLGDHFYTDDFYELGFGGSDYGYEGVEYYISNKNNNDKRLFHRYFNIGLGDHLYDSNRNDGYYRSVGYRYEGDVGEIYSKHY